MKRKYKIDEAVAVRDEEFCNLFAGDDGTDGSTLSDVELPVSLISLTLKTLKTLQTYLVRLM